MVSPNRLNHIYIYIPKNIGYYYTITIPQGLGYIKTTQCRRHVDTKNEIAFN